MVPVEPFSPPSSPASHLWIMSGPSTSLPLSHASPMERATYLRGKAPAYMGRALQAWPPLRLVTCLPHLHKALSCPLHGSPGPGLHHLASLSTWEATSHPGGRAQEVHAFDFKSSPFSSQVQPIPWSPLDTRSDLSVIAEQGKGRVGPQWSTQSQTQHLAWAHPPAC